MKYEAILKLEYRVIINKLSYDSEVATFRQKLDEILNPKPRTKGPK